MNLMQLFSEEAFWHVYNGNEPRMAHSVKLLQKNYPDWEVDEEGEQLPLVLEFNATDFFTFELFIALDDFGNEVYLKNNKTEEVQLVAWWDSTEFHPYFLRWDEMLSLIEYWERIHSIPKDVLLLLWAKFVGNSPAEKKDWAARQAKLQAAYQNLGFKESVIRELVPITMFAVGEAQEEKDYKWTKDPQRGWMFSGKYPCYSTRNEEHIGGDQEFPFAWFNSLLGMITK